MAGIAFLLLVFFLVTTNIQQDYGISTTMSSAVNSSDSISIVRTNLWVNGEGKCMLNDRQILLDSIGAHVAREFDDRALVKNVVVVKTDREVEYQDFITALNQGKKAFSIFYNDLAGKRYNESFIDLSDSLKYILKSQHPVALVENERS